MNNKCIEIKNAGMKPELVKIRDDDGMLRVARFSTFQDAEEALRIIKIMRIDTAFEWGKVVYA